MATLRTATKASVKDNIENNIDSQNEIQIKIEYENNELDNTNKLPDKCPAIIISDYEDPNDIDRTIEEFCSIPGEPTNDEIPEQYRCKDINQIDLNVSDKADMNNNSITLMSNTKNIELSTKKCSNNSVEPSESLKLAETTKSELKTNPKTVKKSSLIKKKIIELIYRLKWSNIIYLSALHIGFVYACIHAATHPVKVWTVAGAFAAGYFSGMGMSVGAHRYWAHRSFKAHTLLRLALMLLQTMTMNGSIFSYSRDHRNHHKYSDTEADPKNPARGLFHAHVGWWLWKKSPVVITMGKKFDVSDLWNDKLVWFQHKFYTPLFLFISVFLPTFVPWLIWNENLLTAFCVMVLIRTTVVLHLLFLVNSFSHHYGYRPYDFRIRPADNRIINYLSMGEGNHNYHHVFPYDYRSNEKAYWEYFDPISGFIHVATLLGLAYDCKEASPRVIQGIIRRKGIPAYFDKKHSLKWRIANAVFDWVSGLLVSFWILYLFIIYKVITGQQLIYY